LRFPSENLTKITKSFAFKITCLAAFSQAHYATAFYEVTIAAEHANLRIRGIIL